MTSSSDTPSHRFLLGIADDLARADVSFPTCLDAALRIRAALNDPALTIDTISRVVQSEPLIAAKVIRLANSAALNPSGREIADVRNAVMRVGFGAIRTLAMAVAVEQLMREQEMALYREHTRELWEHSLEVAALSFVITRHLTPLNPDEALFAGLVHDIGHFYLLYQIARHPGVVRDDEELRRILAEWHVNIGHAVLVALDAPEPILLAVHQHETPFASEHPASLGEILYAANCLAGNANPFMETLAGHPSPCSDRMALVIDDAHEELASIIASLKA